MIEEPDKGVNPDTACEGAGAQFYWDGFAEVFSHEVGATIDIAVVRRALEAAKDRFEQDNVASLRRAAGHT